ncbi:MAG: peptidoglycan DD-metalloendopeptidase family protein [Nocardioidaceae bacterium]
MLVTLAHLLALFSLTFHTSVWPLDPEPEVVGGFAPPAERWGSGHRGVDLLGRQGQPVRAARAGRVTFAGMLAGRGVVVVSHGHTRTTYEPVTAVRRVGDQVEAGDRIGVLQTFGSHCWPRTCLHWGLVDGETYLDPLSLLGAGEIRLLPLFSDLPDAGVGPSSGYGSVLPPGPERAQVPRAPLSPGALPTPLPPVSPAAAPGLFGWPGSSGPWVGLTVSLP